MNILLLSLLASQALAKPLGFDLYGPTTLEDLKPTPKSREDLLRGRKLQVDGSLEKSTHILADAFGGVPGFYHSVASGDPTKDSVIIWTRFTPASVDEEITLEFRMAQVSDTVDEGILLDPANADLKRGLVTVTSETDFVAKIDVTGLPSDAHFVYVFTDGTTTSDVGLTRTAPEGDVSQLTYAFFSCSHFSNGFFHGYDMASVVQDLDLALMLGDYYYEYGTYGTYAKDAAEARDPFLLPVWEVIDLQDYRNRHATYVSGDEGLRNLRRRVPIMATWDDHETTNDSWGNAEQGAGAENHQEVCPVDFMAADADKAEAQCDRDEGDAVERFTAAAQAYWEWMPIRHVAGSMGQIETGTLTKVLEWGNLATIVGLDTRMSHRTEPTLCGSGTWRMLLSVGQNWHLTHSLSMCRSSQPSTTRDTAS